MDYDTPHSNSTYGVFEACPYQNEVLMKVVATTVNWTDCGFRSAQYFVFRLFRGLLRPKHQVLGYEFAGMIEQTGSGVKIFRVGGKVFC